MSEFDWMKSREKIKQYLDDGLHYLREGALEAQHITEATIDRLRTELEIKRLVSHINHLKILLGTETLKLVKKMPELSADKIIDRLIQEIHISEEELKGKQQQIDHLSIVKKPAKKKDKKKKKVSKKI
jgi:hypothetical protein